MKGLFYQVVTCSPTQSPQATLVTRQREGTPWLSSGRKPLVFSSLLGCRLCPSAQWFPAWGHGYRVHRGQGKQGAFCTFPSV